VLAGGTGLALAAWALRAADGLFFATLPPLAAALGGSRR
jgi:hypothetical protein